MGLPGEPVAPMIFRGAQMKAASRIPASTRVLVSTFSRFQIPRRGCISVWQGTAKSASSPPRLSIGGRGIAHCQGNVLRCQILARTDSEARLALRKRCTRCRPLLAVHFLIAVVAPGVPHAGVQGYAVAGLDVAHA